MGLHDAGVGIRLQERVEGKEVRGRLQDPSPRRRPPLQLLEEPTVKAVGRAQVLSLEPLLVRRHVVGRVEAGGEKGGAHDGDALERELRPEGMDRLELGGERIEPRELPSGTGDPRVGPVPPGLGRRRREHDLPCLGDATARVLGKKVVEERAPRARQPHDEERLRDFLRSDLRMPLAVLLETQAIREEADDVLPRRDAAHEREPGLGFESLQHHPEGLAKAVAAQVVQPRGAAGGVEQTFLVERDERQPGPAKHRACGIGGPDNRAKRAGRKHHRVRSPLDDRQSPVCSRGWCKTR